MIENQSILPLTRRRWEVGNINIYSALLCSLLLCLASAHLTIYINMQDWAIEPLYTSQPTYQMSDVRCHQTGAQCSSVTSITILSRQTNEF